MYLWRKSAGPRWLEANEERVRSRSNNKLAIIERPGCKKLQVEVCCRSARLARQLIDAFGGKIDKLPRHWLKRFSHERNSKPIKIGKRLVILNVGGTSVSRPQARQGKSRRKGPSHIVIPAGAAFGTGDHVTTAMSLRLLEEVSRKLKRGWSMLDLGTGSGILALAAKRFGAKRVIAIDNDPSAIVTARGNARANKVDNIDFRIADVRRWKYARRIDVVVANLFSQLLIEILPRLKFANWLILSGVLRDQEREIVRAILGQKINVLQMRRRGKWLAILATLRQKQI